MNGECRRKTFQNYGTKLRDAFHIAAGYDAIDVVDCDICIANSLFNDFKCLVDTERFDEVLRY